MTTCQEERIDAEAEAEALARVRAGDPAAYALLVRAHAPIATRLATFWGAGAHADDVVQEAFVKAYFALDRFREGAPFRPWLLRIVAREASNDRRGEARRREREQAVAALGEPTAYQPSPAEVALLSEQQRRLYAALHRLTPAARSVVTCRYLLDLTEAETAEVLDIAPGTVKSRLHRALVALREELTDV